MTLLLVLLIALLAVTLLGGGGYTYRRHYGPGPGDMMVADRSGGGAGSLLAILGILTFLASVAAHWRQTKAA